MLIGRIIRIVTILLFLGISIFPIFWLILTSLKTPVDISRVTFFFTPTLDNWRFIFEAWQTLLFLRNSIIITSLSTCLTIAFGTLAAYSFVRHDFRGKESIYMDILTVRMMPPVVAAVPLFIIAKELGLLNTYIVLIIIYTVFNLPISIWMMRGFLEEIPLDFEEAALVDGCNRFNAFLRITLPLSVHGMFSTMIICFIFSWNEFMFGNIFTGTATRPLTVISAMTMGQRSIMWGAAASLGLFTAAPVVILTVIVRKYLARALTFGAVR